MLPSNIGQPRICGRLACALLWFAVTTAAFATPKLEPGVALELARWRALHYRDIGYSLQFAIRSGADQIEGLEQIRVSFRGAPQDLVLDWRGGNPAGRISDLIVNGSPRSVAVYEAEHLVIPKQALRAGENLVSLRFRSAVSAAGGPITRFEDKEDGAEYWYTLFVPADASSVFPCFDQPDLKARFTLEISAPVEWRVVSNAPLAQEEAVGDFRRHRFAATEPISSYLFAFAAGPFTEIDETDGPARRSVRLFVRRSKAEKARSEAPAVLDLNRAGLDWFERYFGHRYPFAKYDLLLIPELPYGGMEHAGAAFLREESVLFPFQPSVNDQLRRAQLVLHETSHQWFGDLATMRWFDDLWLKEGFANFMAAKAAAELMPQRLPGIQPWIAFNALKSAAYRTDATQGTTPIWQAMPNLSAAKSAYGNIVYAKAPALLRQAEFFVGEEKFRAGVQDFLRRHAYGAASWNDLVRSLERASGEKLGRWADVWVKRRGMPRITLERRDTGLVLNEVAVLGEQGFWPMRIRVVALGRETRRQDVRITRKRIEVPMPGAREAAILFVNDGDFGYGQFLLDRSTRERLLADPGAVKDDLLRALLLDSLWESVREAQVDPARYIELVLEWLPREPDETTAVQLFGRLRAAYLRYLTPDRRAPLTPRVEAFIADQMYRAPSLSRRIGFFRSFIDMARSESALSRLKALLSGEERIEGLLLRSRDRFSIIEALIALGDPDARELLDGQSRADPSADGRRYAFGAAAARPDATGKSALFERFLNDAQLPESWIEEALGPLNELDQAVLTQPLLRAALLALPRFKRERRIFFVNDWLAAFIGGQTSPQALQAVRAFLAESKLDRDLRLKVLEAVDVLERTVKIRARFS